MGWIEIGPEICSSTDSELRDMMEMDSSVVFAIDANCRYYNEWSFSTLSSCHVSAFSLTPETGAFWPSVEMLGRGGGGVAGRVVGKGPGAWAVGSALVFGTSPPLTPQCSHATVLARPLNYLLTSRHFVTQNATCLFLCIGLVLVRYHALVT